MSIRVRYVPLRLVAAFILVVFTVSCVRDVPAADSDRPNVILIVTDDQNADTIAFMPTLQSELLDRGTSFTRAYAPTPLCCPGRASILRGQYAHNHLVKSNDGVSGGFPQFFDKAREASTLATWLKDAGYHTALIGKYFNAYPEGMVPPAGFSFPGERYVPPGWDEWFGLLDIPGDESANPYAMYGYQMNQNGRVKRYGNDPEDYLTDVLSGLAVDYVERSVGKREPFFLYLAPTAPHLPAIPAPRHQDMFEDVQVPRPPSFNEEDLSDKPTWLLGRPLMSDERIAQLDETYRKQAQMLLAVDEMIASLLDTLRQTGELDSTYIVFTSDHGLHNGEHRLVSVKLTPYDSSARVPLVVRGPNVPARQSVDELTLLSDIAPTLTDLASASTPGFIDGRSFAPWLGKGNPSTVKERQQILHEFWPREGFPIDIREESVRPLPIPVYQALRSQDYLYVDYSYPDGRQEEELYDLEQDPFELNNLARSADPTLLRTLSAKLEELRSCQAAACRQAESSPF